MKTVGIVLGIIVIVTGLSSYAVVSNYGEPGSGVSQTETRSVEPFTKIAFIEFGTINISTGTTQSVSITTDDNLMDLIETTVEDGELTIRPEKPINPKSGYVVNVVVPDLEAIQLAGAAKLNLDDIQADTLQIELAGACGAYGSGSVDELEMLLAGACRARLRDLTVATAQVEIAGTGSAVVNATESIDAMAAGFASITCHGNPTDVKREAKGISRIEIVASTN